MAKKISSKKTTSKGADSAVPQDVVEHVNKAPCSLEFSRDAKGQARWGLKVYGERDDMEDVISEVLDHDRRLRSETSG